MLIAMLGSAGTGLVWGWLMGRLGGRVRQPLRDGLALGAATLFLAGEVLVLVDWQALALFLGATGLALLVHLGWRRELRDRFGPPGS